MSPRWIVSRVGLVVAIASYLAPPLAGQAPGSTASSSSRTAGRRPDLNPNLTGVWNFTTNTPLERPKEMGTRQRLTTDEIAKREAQALQTRIDAPPREGDPGTYNRFWTDQPRVTTRTSMIVDPSDGRLPPLTPEAQAIQTRFAASRKDVDDDSPTPGGWVDAIGPHGLSVRCIVGFNAGPPMTGSGYNANVQIFQSADTVVLLNEMIHTARVVPMDGRPPLPGTVRQWAGSSRGRWEGKTLIVETTNFERVVSDFANDRPAGPAMRVTERFSLLDKNTLLYRYTVDDPSWFTKPWTAEIEMVRSDQPLYEYACHEGNISMEGILSGARARDAAPATALPADRSK
jgi:hypothetical protein